MGVVVVCSMARVRRLYQDWLESRSFADRYLKFRFTIPRRLTKKELLRLREVRADTEEGRGGCVIFLLTTMCVGMARCGWLCDGCGCVVVCGMVCVGHQAQVVYRITVKKLIHGFTHLRTAFKIPPTGDPARDLECLKDVSEQQEDHGAAHPG